MDFNEYQAWTATTAIYPQEISGLPIAPYYLTLGLVDEVRELSELFAFRVQPKSADWVVDTGNLIKEAGDICWFVAQLLATIDMNFSDAVELAGSNLVSVRNMQRTLTHMSTEVAQVAGCYSKALRDNGGRLECPTQLRIYAHVLKLLSILISLLNKEGIDLQDVLEHNKVKLKSRKERSQLQGSGDNR